MRDKYGGADKAQKVHHGEKQVERYKKELQKAVVLSTVRAHCADDNVEPGTHLEERDKKVYRGEERDVSQSQEHRRPLLLMLLQDLKTFGDITES